MTTTPAVAHNTDVGHLSEPLLIRLRDRLFIECSHLAAQSDEYRATLSDLAQRSDPAGLLEYERAAAAVARCGDAIIETFQALLRLDAGTYGVCEDCGGPISPARLEVTPRARSCVTCVPPVVPRAR